ncbi:ABC transporter ATP-binding protein [Candidatus Liberibacter brunswickensis]|uniref:ABC transporter ATP-binding protein n=1 Tax=Candidatus Liberibacter brunswickensis TaxID=1968796 RepID=UPI002FE1D2C5
MHNFDNTISLFRFQILYLKYCWGFILGELLAIFIYSGVSLYIPVISANILGKGGIDPHHWLIFMSLLILFIISSSMRYYFATMVGERMILFMQRDIVAKIIKYSPSFFNSRSHGEIFSTLVKDAERIKTTVGISMSIILRNSMVGIGALYMMFLSSIYLSLIVVSIVCIVLFLFVISLKFKRNKINHHSTNEKKLLDIFSDIIKSVMVLQSFNAGEKAIKLYNMQSQNTYKSFLKITLVRTCVVCFVVCSLSFSLYVVFLFGAHYIIISGMSGGKLGKFLYYTFLFLGTIRSSSGFIGGILQAISSLQRFRDLMVCKLDIVSPTPYKTFSSPVLGSISFNNVSFLYPGESKRSVLKNINFTVLPGQTIALVGNSGAGKTSIFSLILRFYDPSSGNIKLEGIDLTDLSLEEIRRSITWVPQNPIIINASVHDNIAIGLPNANREAVQNAATIAQAHEFIICMDKGYDTILGNHAFNLSAGQIQRIAIARAILKDSPILLLDEMGSALDIKSEQKILKVLREKRKGKTTIFASHRLSTIQNGDIVFLINNQVIVEKGIHEDLLKDSSLYARYRSGVLCQSI